MKKALALFSIALMLVSALAPLAAVPPEALQAGVGLGFDGLGWVAGALTALPLIGMAMSNEELASRLQKAQITSSIGGLASPQQAQQFIDMAVDQTAILNQLRIETGIRTSYELHDISLGEPVTVAATEAQAPADEDVTAPTIHKPVLQPKEMIAAFDVSFDMIRKNIEGQGLNQTLNRIFSKRFGKDIVLMGFMGDTDLAPATAGSPTRREKTLMALDGFVKGLVDDPTTHDYVIPADPTYGGAGGVFSDMLRQLPKDYRDDRSILRYFVSQNALDDYEDEITSRQTAAADMVMFGDRQVSRYKRVVVTPVYGLDDDTVILTIARNMAVGFGRRMTVGTDVYNRRRVVEVTMTADVDVEHIRGEAAVVGQKG